MMKYLVLLPALLLTGLTAAAWGFYGHRFINHHAVYLLPPGMMVMFKPNIPYLSEHAVDPDKRRYIVPVEGPRHFIDLDFYGNYPYLELPRKWQDAEKKFSEDTLNKYGIVPWWIIIMLNRLTKAFEEENKAAILKLSSEIGHYIGDAHVPLHASSNYNGQKTGQHGIHGLWETRIPELLAEKEWNFFIGQAEYISDPLNFIWERVLESAAAADTVLKREMELTVKFARDRKYAFEDRNGVMIRQYSLEFTIAYDRSMHHMVEKRMRQSIFTIASFWYTAWVNAGQPDLSKMTNNVYSKEEAEELKKMNNNWRNLQQAHGIRADCEEGF